MTGEVKGNKAIRFILGLVIVSMLFCMGWLWINYNTLAEVARIDDEVARRQNENTRYYVREYQMTKVALDETTVKLTEVRNELEIANTELSTTRGELSEVQGINDQLKEHIAELERYRLAAEAKGDALETMIGSFKKKNRELDRDLQSVRKELAVYQPDISDFDEGRTKVLLFKNHIHLVKKNMSGLRRKAEELRLAAEKERDRLELLYGNGGYMIKDGQSKAVLSNEHKNVQIDVKIVN